MIYSGSQHPHTLLQLLELKPRVLMATMTSTIILLLELHQYCTGRIIICFVRRVPSLPKYSSELSKKIPAIAPIAWVRGCLTLVYLAVCLLPYERASLAQSEQADRTYLKVLRSYIKVMYRGNRLSWTEVVVLDLMIS